MASISQAKQRSAYKGRREVTVSHRRCCLTCRFHHGAISAPTPNIPSSFLKAPKHSVTLRKASRLGDMVSVSHAAVMEVEECQNISSPLQIEDFSAESSEESIDSLEEPLKKKQSKLKVKIKPKVSKTGSKLGQKKRKKKPKLTTFCTECNTNEETVLKLVKHVNTWHKVTSMKVRYWEF